MKNWDLMPTLLLLMLSLALSVMLATVLAVSRRHRWARARAKRLGQSSCSRPGVRACLVRRPECWLAIRGRRLKRVQEALALHNTRPCSWLEGLVAGDERLFLAPPVKGWILVTGSGLPNPREDVDACFRFVTQLSRAVGQVQFFSACPMLNHHAWIKARRGRVVRAYAWAGTTLWQQGRLTPAERELHLKCLDYSETPDPVFSGEPDPLAQNTEKVPLLAARWSLDPGRLDEQLLESRPGVAGQLSHRF